MVAIDDDPRAVRSGESGEPVDGPKDAAACEHHLAHQDEVMLPERCGCEKALFEVSGRVNRDDVDVDVPVLRPA